jgi:hypothetical protein
MVGVGLQLRFVPGLRRAVLLHANVMRDTQRGDVESRKTCPGVHWNLCEPLVSGCTRMGVQVQFLNSGTVAGELQLNRLEWNQRFGVLNEPAWNTVESG